jgi:hypothetical protein
MDNSEPAAKYCVELCDREDNDLSDVVRLVAAIIAHEISCAADRRLTHALSGEMAAFSESMIAGVKHIADTIEISPIGDVAIVLFESRVQEYGLDSRDDTLVVAGMQLSSRDAMRSRKARSQRRRKMKEYFEDLRREFKHKF